MVTVSVVPPVVMVSVVPPVVTVSVVVPPVVTVSVVPLLSTVLFPVGLLPSSLSPLNMSFILSTISAIPPKPPVDTRTGALNGPAPSVSSSVPPVCVVAPPV